MAARRVVSFQPEINPLGCPTAPEPPVEFIGEFSDLSNSSPGAANENPGALAGASGADLHTMGIVSNYYRNRADAATVLCLAIAECRPEDALTILDAALRDLRDKAAFGGNPYFRDAVLQYRAERNRSGRVA